MKVEDNIPAEEHCECQATPEDDLGLSRSNGLMSCSLHLHRISDFIDMCQIRSVVRRSIITYNEYLHPLSVA